MLLLKSLDGILFETDILQVGTFPGQGKFASNLSEGSNVNFFKLCADNDIISVNHLLGMFQNNKPNKCFETISLMYKHSPIFACCVTWSPLRLLAEEFLRYFSFLSTDLCLKTPVFSLKLTSFKLV